MRTNIDEIDFSELYKIQKNRSTNYFKTKSDWDKKAKSFFENAKTSVYADDFLKFVDFSGVNSVLDFACGAGALSLKAAKLTDIVYAYDYSPKMLEYLEQNAKILGINNIKIKQKAFEDSWYDIPVCDIVFASRCLEVQDLKATLQKLISKAKYRVYMTFKVEKSFVDHEILKAIGKKVEPKPNYIYLINILAQMGYLPHVEYIKSPSCGKVLCEQDLITKVEWGLNENLSDNQKDALKIYFQSGEKAYDNPMIWAFVWIEV